MKKQIVELGTFKINSNKLLITDPCYDVGTWCSGQVENVCKGNWNAHIIKSDERDWGDRCAELYALHESLANKDHEYNWEICDFEVGVDSGQAGIFNPGTYQLELTEPYSMIGNKEYSDASTKHILEKEQNLLQIFNKTKGKLSNIGLNDEDLVKCRKYINNLQSRLNSEPETTTNWYEMCCDKTLSNIGAGVVTNDGVVSRSGFGDGSYEAFTAKQNGEIIGIKIIFISQEEVKEKC